MNVERALEDLINGNGNITLLKGGPGSGIRGHRTLEEKFQAAFSRSKERIKEWGVKDGDAESFFKLFVLVRQYVKEYKNRKGFYEEPDDVLGTMNLNFTKGKMRSMINKYGEIYGEKLFGKDKKLVWHSSSYSSTGAGAFGKQNPQIMGVGGYNKAMIGIENK